MPEYPLTVFPQHQALLAASAISPEVARQRGYVSVDTKAQLERYGFAQSQRIVPGLLIPLHATDGEIRLYQYRPDQPRLDSKDRPVKYETPYRSRLILDIPPAVLPQLGDPGVPLYVTEGARKADAAVTAGLASIALLGVNGWRGTNGTGGKTALPDWDDIALNDRAVFVAFDSDVMTKAEVSRALTALTRWLGYKGARVRHVLLPAGEGGAKTGLDDWLAAGNRAAQLEEFAEDPGRPEGGPLTSATSATRATDIPVVQWDGDLGGLLDDILAFTGRFTVYPSEAAHVAHVLWIAHTHQMQAWESTPRIAFLSPEPASGKTRTLEVTELLVPRPVEAVNTTPAYLFRRVADPAGLPTLLYDEVDTVFGPKAKDNEEIRGLLNAGHRRGAVAGRALKQGDRIVTEELPAYCALALAGIGALPDTVLSRSVVVRMRRRARGEKVEPFRRRMAVGAGLARAGPCSGCSACSGFPRAGQRKPGCPFACRPAADLRRGRGHVYERHPVGA